MDLTLQLQKFSVRIGNEMLDVEDVRKVMSTAILLGVELSGTASFSSQLGSPMFVE